MLSAKFLSMIETHSQQITEQVLQQVMESSQTDSIRLLPRSELREHCRQVLEHLGDWLTVSGRNEVAQHYEARGRMRAAEAVPLSEAIFFLLLLKRKMLNYVREQSISMTNIDFYAQDELRRRVGLFFDWAIYHMARGYESSQVAAVAKGA